MCSGFDGLVRFSAEVGKTVALVGTRRRAGRLGVMVGVGGITKACGKEASEERGWKRRWGTREEGTGRQPREWPRVGRIRGGLRGRQAGRPSRGGGLESAEAMWRWKEGFFHMWQAGLKLSPEPWKVSPSTLHGRGMISLSKEKRKDPARKSRRRLGFVGGKRLGSFTDKDTPFPGQVNKEPFTKNRLQGKLFRFRRTVHQETW